MVWVWLAYLAWEGAAIHSNCLTVGCKFAA
jgi:hypothetical protein